MVGRLRQGWTIRLFSIFIIYNLAGIPESTVLAAVNITIDDSDPSIYYAPPGAWGRTNETSLDYGGSHMLTSNPQGTASFNFTGTAIYFMSPLWPYIVNTAISLDRGPSTLVDLVDHSRPMTDGGPETVQSQVVWQATGLNNTQHNLLIFVGAGQPYAIVDGLIYTINASPSSSVSPTSTTSLASTSKTPPNNATLAKSPSTLAIIFISLFAASLVVIFGLLWRLFDPRRKRLTFSPQAQVESSQWTIEGELSAPLMPIAPYVPAPLPNAGTIKGELSPPLMPIAPYVPPPLPNAGIIEGELSAPLMPIEPYVPPPLPDAGTIKEELSAPLMPIESYVPPPLPNAGTNSESCAEKSSPHDMEDGTDFRADPPTSYLQSDPGPPGL